MKTKLRVGGFIGSSVSDGPGVRSVLFLQGCHRGCPQCHNRELQDPCGGTEVALEEMVQYLQKNCLNRQLTISGGEPLEQFGALKKLLRILSADGFDLCLYTGYEKEEVPKEIFPYLHYLKVGAFLVEQQDFTIPYVGSRNQRMLNLYEEENRA